jgi:hypothetical protein
VRALYKFVQVLVMIHRLLWMGPGHGQAAQEREELIRLRKESEGIAAPAQSLDTVPQRRQTKPSRPTWAGPGVSPIRVSMMGET